jgi:hypothetical protein
MNVSIEEEDYGVLRMLFEVVLGFADVPEYDVAKSGGERFALQDDYASTIGHYRKYLLNKYPDLADLAFMKLITEVDSIFARRGYGGEAFDEIFWTNHGYQHHPDWKAIREKAREFLLR